IAKSKKGRRRIDQLTDWLGTEGSLIFDEGHRAKISSLIIEAAARKPARRSPKFKIRKSFPIIALLTIRDGGDRRAAPRLYD
ncbi:MAG TPA: hypothetical protein VK308_08020, partial [Pyrinomonadaceae bacterium]|nr:hypothetical protein [Pyrinomonadaceae bacterium]